MREAPTENLVRSWAGPDALSLRDTGEGDGNTIVGYLSRFNEWTEIRSTYEGHFMERILPGAFDRTVAARGPAIRLLYDHGKDPSIGNKPLGTFSVLEPRDAGQWYEGQLFDAGYVNDLKPALRANALGSSFRFSVPEGGDAWETPMQPTAWNPNRLRERSVIDTDLYEGGPVTFPAYAGASAGMRSATDEFVGSVLRDPLFLARFVERTGGKVAENLVLALRDLERDDDPGTLAQGVDAAIDAAIKCLTATDDDYNPAQALALLVAGESTSDLLLAALGVSDADDPGETVTDPADELGSAGGGLAIAMNSEEPPDGRSAPQTPPDGRAGMSEADRDARARWLAARRIA